MESVSSMVYVRNELVGSAETEGVDEMVDERES